MEIKVKLKCRHIPLLCAIILFVLSILSGCENNPSSSDEAEAFTTLNNTTTSAITENDIVPLTQLEKAINMAQPFLDNGGVLYDLNNDNFPELITNARSDLYMYAIYDLTDNGPVILGEFFQLEAIDNSNNCVIYKCYDNINDEVIYLNEKNYYDTQYIDSSLFKIDLYNDSVDNYVVATKEAFTENHDNYFYILNNNGKISAGNDSGETIIQSLSTNYEILETFEISIDKYDTCNFNNYPSAKLDSINNNDNIIRSDEKFIHEDSFSMTKSLYDEYIKQGGDYINKFSNLTSLYIYDKEADISFLYDNKTIEMLRISSLDVNEVSKIIKKMFQLRYLCFYLDSDNSISLDFLKNNTNLEILHLGYGLNSGMSEAYKPLYTLPNLKVIAFYRSSHLTDEQYNEIKENMPNCMIVFI